jgi:ribosomal protein S18 acetylase RimI-like enzyme
MRTFVSFWYRNAVIAFDLHHAFVPRGSVKSAQPRRSRASAPGSATASRHGDDGAPRRGARQKEPPAKGPLDFVVRPVRRPDLDQIVALDATLTGLEKRAYWRNVYRRYGESERDGQTFLVADAGARVVGFVIGEVRDWEFGSPPCGWVFTIDVQPEFRLAGVGSRLLDALCASFRRAGVRTVRTLLARDNTLVLSFFRSQGMMAAPFIPLEMEIGGTSP